MELSYPPLLLPLSLLFWGWRSDTPVAAALVLLLAAAAGRSPWRWHMEAGQFHRVGDLTAVLFLGAVGYFVAGDGDTPPVYALLRWLPAIFAPLLLAQLYSTAAKLPLSALFYSLRRYGGAEAVSSLDFRLPYAFFCILAAGSGSAGDDGYFVAIAGLCLWTLWHSRPRRAPDAVWLLGFVLAVGLGYGGQLGLSRLQNALEEWAVDWLGDAETDPYKAHTAIGDVGHLKLSGRIVMRVDAGGRLNAPLLLKEAAYDRYAGQSWLAGKAPFEPYAPPRGDGPAHIAVLRSLSHHSALLPLPSGLRGLDIAPPADLQHNRLGAVKWQDAPSVLRYRIAYDPQALDRTPPTAEDRRLDPDTATLLEPLVGQLGLRGLAPKRAIAAVAELFARDFGYSLYLGDGQSDDGAALKDFLYRRKAGHCEYFAAATTLLLRAAGIPARFAVGYSIQEYGPAERLYLVRQRHAHAWTEAYVDGAWLTVDNTPARWGEAEAQTDPWWQGVADAWSRWSTAFQAWRWERVQRPEAKGFPLWGWLVLPLSLWLGWRLYRSRQRTPAPRATAANHVATTPDTEYARLQQALLAAGHPPRLPGETPLRWLRRLGLSAYEEEVRAYYRRRHGR